MKKIFPLLMNLCEGKSFLHVSNAEAGVKLATPPPRPHHRFCFLPSTTQKKWWNSSTTVFLWTLITCSTSWSSLFEELYYCQPAVNLRHIYRRHVITSKHFSFITRRSRKLTHFVERATNHMHRLYSTRVCSHVNPRSRCIWALVGIERKINFPTQSAHHPCPISSRFANKMHDKKSSNICWSNFHINKKCAASFSTHKLKSVFVCIVFILLLCNLWFLLHFSTKSSTNLRRRTLFGRLPKLFFYTKMKLYNLVLLLGGSFCSILEYKPIQFSCPVSMYTIFFFTIFPNTTGWLIDGCSRNIRPFCVYEMKLSTNTWECATDTDDRRAAI